MVWSSARVLCANKGTNLSHSAREATRVGNLSCRCTVKICLNPPCQSNSVLQTLEFLPVLFRSFGKRGYEGRLQLNSMHV
jgi:hypothetical protein